jgi:hypothetical protein
MAPTADEPTEDLKRIGVMAIAGATRVELEAYLGRPLADAELAYYRQMRVRAKVQRAKRKAEGPASVDERVAKIRNRHRSIPRLTCADPKRRARYEADPAKWLRYYLPSAFTNAFQKPHLAIIDGALNAQESRGRFAVAAERGIGKSTVLWGLVLFLILSGRERFPVCIGWQQSSSGRALRFWRSALAFNPRLAADYPEYAQPFTWAKGSSFKLATAIWEDTGEVVGAALNHADNMIVFPDNRGCIGCESINGNPRGLNHPTLDGSILRPTLALIDDPQSRGVAKSPVQTESVINIIDGDIGGLGQASKKLPMLLSGNCIIPYDVMHHYLEHPEWQSVRIPRILSWPEDFDDPGSKTRIKWDEWNRIRIEGQQLRDTGKAARAYYTEHKAALTKGMKVSNTIGFDKRKGQVDALYAAMEAYYVMGHHAFHAERQQNPVAQIQSSYELRVETILSRTSGYPRLHAPENSIVVMGVDINYVGFNWACVAADHGSQARYVVAHGQWPSRGGMIPNGCTDDQARLLIRKYMAQFTQEVINPMTVTTGKRTAKVSTVCWDASSGKWQDSIAYAVKAVSTHAQMWALKAFGSKSYHPRASDIRQGNGWHTTLFPRIGRVLVVNSDYWKENMQRGFLVEPSEPGAISLYSPDPEEMHRDLASQIVGERLIEKIVTDKTEVYNFMRTPGMPNDRSDALVYACALTGYEGVGEVKVSRQRKSYRSKDLRR